MSFLLRVLATACDLYSGVPECHVIMTQLLFLSHCTRTSIWWVISCWGVVFCHIKISKNLLLKNNNNNFIKTIPTLSFSASSSKLVSLSIRLYSFRNISWNQILRDTFLTVTCPLLKVTFLFRVILRSKKFSNIDWAHPKPIHSTPVHYQYVTRVFDEFSRAL